MSSARRVPGSAVAKQAAFLDIPGTLRSAAVLQLVDPDVRAEAAEDYVFCYDCIHWDPLTQFKPADGASDALKEHLERSESTGECRRRAPACADAEGQAVWPITHGDDSCGDGEPFKTEDE
jgi:hypothetical protein